MRKGKEEERERVKKLSQNGQVQEDRARTQVKDPLAAAFAVDGLAFYFTQHAYERGVLRDQGHHHLRSMARFPLAFTMRPLPDTLRSECGRWPSPRPRREQ